MKQKSGLLLLLICAIPLFVAACTSPNINEIQNNEKPEETNDLALNSEDPQEDEPTLAETNPPDSETPTAPASMSETTFPPLPQRSGPRTETSGTVPHVQIGVDLVEAVNDRLYELAFSLPGVENRPTIISLPGARGMWLGDDVPIVHRENIVSGREFAHIHPDGSLHLALPYERALEAVEMGWAERHPWADERDGWEGFIMLFTPQSMAELDVTFQLILESYNFITGENVKLSDLEP